MNSGVFSQKMVLLSVAMTCVLLSLLFYSITTQLPALPISQSEPQSVILVASESASPRDQASAAPADNTAAQTVSESASEPGIAALAAADCLISPEFPAEIQQWCGLISQYAPQHNLEPDLVAALIVVESAGNDQAISHNGAVGLMQIMPRDGLAADFQCPNGPCFASRPTTKELKNPEYNLAFGTKLLANLLRRLGDVREALVAYGPAGVGYTYADKVLGLYNSIAK